MVEQSYTVTPAISSQPNVRELGTLFYGTWMEEFLNISLSEVYEFDLEFGMELPVGGDELVRSGLK